MATLNTQQLPTANVLGQQGDQQPMGLGGSHATNAAMPTSMTTQGTAPTPFATTAVGQTVTQPFATSTMGNQQMGMYTNTGDAASVPLGHLDQILNQENALLRNARTSGLESAAGRGLQNSSIAAGAAQRASLDYAMPILGHAQDTFNQREQRQWQTEERLGGQEWQSGERGLDRTHDFSMQDARQQWQSGESQLDRDWQSNEALRDRDWRSTEAQLDRELTTAERQAMQAWQSGEAALTRDQQVIMANLQEEMARAQRQWTAEQNQLDRDQQLTMAEVQNWLANESFMRDFNAQLATMPINNTANLLNFISQQAITNPEIYTPDIVSGMSEFFTTNAMDVLSRYFPNYFQNTGGA